MHESLQNSPACSSTALCAAAACSAAAATAAAAAASALFWASDFGFDASAWCKFKGPQSLITDPSCSFVVEANADASLVRDLGLAPVSSVTRDAVDKPC